MTYYRNRLARIHAQDFGQFAESAARRLVAELGNGAGLVMDLGCGPGDLCEVVVSAGYDYVGVDISPDMLSLARQRHPRGRFEQGSAFDLPDAAPARAIVAIGEVINYASDPRAGVTGLHQWLRACRQALGPGGILLVDVAGPLRADPRPATTHYTGEDYRMEVTISTDPARRLLTRTIRVIDAEGEEVETHQLELIDPLEVLAALRSAGFEATPLPGYTEDLPLPRGWSAFLARVILDS